MISTRVKLSTEKSENFLQFSPLSPSEICKCLEKNLKRKKIFFFYFSLFKKTLPIENNEKTCNTFNRGFISGIVVGFGASLVRDSSAVMIGHYFKRRRQFVEMIVMAGEGVGIALFSVILKEGVG